MGKSNLTKQSTIYKQGEPASTGTINTAANLGTGEGVYASNAPANQLNFKSLKVTGGLGISSTANDITVDASGIIDGLPKFTFSTSTTDSDPGNGFFRFNNGTPAAATFIYLDLLDAYGANFSLTTKNLVVGSQLYLKGLNSLSKWIVYTVTAQPTDATTYLKIPVSYVNSGASAFANNDTVEWNIFGSIPSSFVNVGGIIKLETTAIGSIDNQHPVDTLQQLMQLEGGTGPYLITKFTIQGLQNIAGACTIKLALFTFSTTGSVSIIAGTETTLTANFTVNTQNEVSANLPTPYLLPANTNLYVSAVANNANFQIFSKSGGLASALSVTFQIANATGANISPIAYASRNNSGRCLYVKCT